MWALLSWIHDPSVMFRMVSSLWTTSFLFYPTVNRSCVLSNRTSGNNAWIWTCPWNVSQGFFFFLFNCLSSGSASVHLCLLFFQSHFFVLLPSQVHFNRHFSSSTDLQAWNFFSRHLRKWKWLEHSWTECLVSCKS